jgi:hypothetical protein
VISNVLKAIFPASGETRSKTQSHVYKAFSLPLVHDLLKFKTSNKIRGGITREKIRGGGVFPQLAICGSSS